MRVALISDQHGNDFAFRAVAEDSERVGVDRLVCLGDVAQGGAQPAETLDRLRSLGCETVLGNSDDFLLRIPEASPEPITPQLLEVREWTLRQLDERHLDQIRSFQTTVGLEGGAILCFHGSPPARRRARIRGRFPGALPHRLAARGPAEPRGLPRPRLEPVRRPALHPRTRVGDRKHRLSRPFRRGTPLPPGSARIAHARTVRLPGLVPRRARGTGNAGLRRRQGGSLAGDSRGIDEPVRRARRSDLEAPDDGPLGGVYTYGVSVHGHGRSARALTLAIAREIVLLR